MTWRLPIAGVLIASLGASPANANETVISSTETPYPSVSALERCLQLHEQGRLSQLQGSLFEARTALRACAVMDCSASLQADCSAWLTDVERSVPSVFVVLEGSVPAGAVVLLDGEVISLEALAVALELEPGEHVVRLEHPGGPPTEARFALSEGQKGAVVRTAWRLFPAAPAPEPRPVSRDAVDRAPPAGAPFSTENSFWDGVSLESRLLGGAAVACAGVSVALLVSALSQRREAEESCAPLCSASVTSPIERRLLWADISGIAALVLGGIAVGDYVFGSPTGGPASPRVGISSISEAR